MNDSRARCADRSAGLRCQLVAGHRSGHAARDSFGLQIWHGSCDALFATELDWADGFEPATHRVSA
jgi:hypothetical protein